MTLLRLYLLGGLIAHKALWEILKRRLPPPAPRRQSPWLPLIKLTKVGLLLFFLAQTALPPILPIRQPPGPLEPLGAVLFTAGLALAVAGRLALGDSWANIETPTISSLVDRGPYRVVRHPIYVGDVLLVAGLELALNSWLVLLAVPLAVTVVRKARAEEAALAAASPAYAAYRRRTLF